MHGGAGRYRAGQGLSMPSAEAKPNATCSLRHSYVSSRLSHVLCSLKRRPSAAAYLELTLEEAGVMSRVECWCIHGRRHEQLIGVEQRFPLVRAHG